MSLASHFFTAAREGDVSAGAMLGGSIADYSFNGVPSPRSGYTRLAPLRPAVQSAYEFAEFHAARLAVSGAFQHAGTDSEIRRNALWALDQLEAVTYAPKVLANSDGSLTFEWETDRGSGALEIGRASCSYHVWPQGGSPLTGSGGAEEVNSGVGMLVSALLYPTSSAHRIATGTVCGSAPTGGPCSEGSEATHDSRTGGADDLASVVSGVFASAAYLEFEDGVENAFTLHLMDLVRKHGARAVEKVARVLWGGRYQPEAIAQTLLCLGRISDPATHPARSRIVRVGLRSTSAKVRDAATVAIDSMADRGAEAELRAAIGSETLPTLKEDMRLVLASLQPAG